MVTTKKCAFGECKNDSRYPERLQRSKDGDDIVFSHFPGPKRQKKRREKWIKACHRGDSFVCTKDSYICSLHFVGEKGPTKENPDPISAIASKEKVERLHRKHRLVRLVPDAFDERREEAKRACNKKTAAKSLLKLATAPALSGKSLEELSVAETLAKLADESFIDDNMESNLTTCMNVDDEILQNENPDGSFIDDDMGSELTTSMNVDDPASPANITSPEVTTSPEVPAIKYNESSTQTKPEVMKYLFLSKIEDPGKTQHYTGMSKECLDFIFDHTKERAGRIHTWKGTKRTNKRQLHSKYLKQKKDFSKLTTREQFVFILVKLRRNPSLTMLCDIFGISDGIGSRIFITWVLFLEKELDFLIPFSSNNDLKGVPMPETFQKIKNLRAIIDCTEFFIEKPSRPSSQRSTHSQYKSTNTFKLLISISPVPHINFVSQLYTGSISDKEIVRKSGFLDKLNPGDVVMADKGFNIQDLLVKHECQLIGPPIMRKNNVSAAASTATRRVATSRVHIERMIRRVKICHSSRSFISHPQALFIFNCKSLCHSCQSSV